MTGKLESRRHRRNRSASSNSSRSSSNDSRKFSRKYDNRRYRSGRDRSRDRYRRSYSKSRSSSSSEDRGRGSSSKYGDRKKPLRTKYDDLMDKVKVKEEPLSDDERSRSKSRYASANVKSRYSDDDGDDRNRKNRPNDRGDSWQNRRVKKERWGGGGGGGDTAGQDREHEWGKKSDRTDNGQNKKPLVDKAKPDFGLSGKLTEDTNTFNGVVIKYSEPPEARKPKRRWRLYPFKGDECLKTLHIHRQSAFLIGRDRKVADIPIDHPSCSKQHAALQYRLVTYKRDDGLSGKRICPYIIDLESANGTFVNNKKIEAKKYVELLERDVIKFGFSSREYVLLHEHSKDSGEDDNVFDNDK